MLLLIDKTSLESAKAVADMVGASYADLSASSLDRYYAEADRAASGSGLGTIKISGVLTKKPDFLAMLFGGGTTYKSIMSEIEALTADKDVDTIVLDIDSPGGAYDGLFEVIDAIQATPKKVIAKVNGMAASAAYAIASQADEIIAQNRASMVGSIGVVATLSVSDKQVTITSSDAPKKRPDVKTKEGVEIVREELDAMHKLFVDAIAEGRGVTAEKINAEYGQGATLLAGEALRRGMIDSIADAKEQRAKGENAKSKSRPVGSTKEITMDLKELKAQHPDVYAAAVQEGIDQERDRVTAHLIMGEKSGAIETASAAIKDGSGMTATLQATYLTAGMNRADIADRQSESNAASAGDQAAASAQAEGDEADAVLAIIESRLGVTGE